MSDELEVIRFRIRRGTFRIPRDLRVDDPDEWARRFASSVPDEKNVTISSTRDGDVDVFTWRVVTPYRAAY
jgi:hypothetical protein